MIFEKDIEHPERITTLAPPHMMMMVDLHHLWRNTKARHYMLFREIMQ